MSGPTAEHAFQAAKCVNESDLLEIKAAISPGFAKRLGRQVELRDDWEEPEDRLHAEHIGR